MKNRTADVSTLILALANIALAVLAVAILVSTTGCSRGPDMRLLEEIAAMDNPVYQGAAISEGTRDEIRALLERYGRDIRQKAEYAETLGRLYEKIGQKYLEIEIFRQTIGTMTGSPPSEEPPEAGDRERGLYLEALTLDYMDRGIYRKAYDSIQKAIEYFPANSNLYYNAAICAGYIGKSFSVENDRENGAVWMSKAVAYYKRAIDLAPGHIDALYGLAVLYVHELKIPEEAVGLLLSIKEREQYNTDARFLLAQAYYLLGRYEDAIGEYGEIGKITRIDSKKAQARANIEKIRSMMTGGPVD